MELGTSHNYSFAEPTMTSLKSKVILKYNKKIHSEDCLCNTTSSFGSVPCLSLAKLSSLTKTGKRKSIYYLTKEDSIFCTLLYFEQPSSSRLLR